jgi:hypothetical protein
MGIGEAELRSAWTAEGGRPYATFSATYAAQPRQPEGEMQVSVPPRPIAELS